MERYIFLISCAVLGSVLVVCDFFLSVRGMILCERWGCSLDLLFSDRMSRLRLRSL